MKGSRLRLVALAAWADQRQPWDVLLPSAYRAIGVSIVYLVLSASIAAAGFFGAMVLGDALAPLVLKKALPVATVILIGMAIGFGVVVMREMREDRGRPEDGPWYPASRLERREQESGKALELRCTKPRRVRGRTLSYRRVVDGSERPEALKRGKGLQVDLPYNSTVQPRGSHLGRCRTAFQPKDIPRP